MMQDGEKFEGWPINPRIQRGALCIMTKFMLKLFWLQVEGLSTGIIKGKIVAQISLSLGDMKTPCS